MSGFLSFLASALPVLGPWARRAWCRRQRARLLGVVTGVVWVPVDEVPWALWGAEHRFFQAERAGRLVYLRRR